MLQHPHERWKYYNTAKLATRGIQNSRVLRGVEFAPGVLEAELSGKDAYLLYPRKGASRCEDVVLSSKSTVVVLDGTWAEAGKILHVNPYLKTLPCITFEQPLRSTYRIRKQPRENYLSTIESISYLLKLNALAHGLTEQAKLYDRLLIGFALMIEQQLLYVEGSERYAQEMFQLRQS
jgi:DTW domain-containing protein YfiP